MTDDSTSPLVVHGWKIYAHALFLDQVETLLREVERLRERKPSTYATMNATKRLAAIAKLAFDVVPQDPTRPEYRQGRTLGGGRKHWFRAKFYQQYRLFFRYSTRESTIVYAWVNDEHSKRAYRSRDDTYTTFQKMLMTGDPPDDWEHLLEHSRQNMRRLRQAACTSET